MTLVISKTINSHYEDFHELNQFFGKDVKITIEDNSSQNKDELLADFFALVKKIDIDQKESVTLIVSTSDCLSVQRRSHVHLSLQHDRDIHPKEHSHLYTRRPNGFLGHWFQKQSLPNG